MDGELHDLVRRYRITWETRAEMGARERAVAPIGYTIELNGITDHADHQGTIACPECHAVEDALQRVVLEVAPGEVTHVGRHAVQLGTAHEGRPEVTATVTVIHRDGGGANRAPGADERERLDEILGRLRSLGAQEGHWRDERGMAARG